MKAEIRKQILELSTKILDDQEYFKVVKLIDEDKLNTLRLFLSEKLDYLTTVSILNNDQQLEEEAKVCNVLEDLVLNEYLERLEYAGE